MNVFIFCADIYCEACGNALRDAATQKPANPADESSYDSNDYPKGPYPDGGGASDSYQNCARCGVFLANPLTSDGVEYTLNQFEDACFRTSALDSWTEEFKTYEWPSENGDAIRPALERYNALPPIIGTGCTLHLGSDSYPCTVVELLAVNRVVIQRDDWTKTGESCRFSRSPKADKYRVHRRRNGRWFVSPGQDYGGALVAIGERCFYHDPDF